MQVIDAIRIFRIERRRSRAETWRRDHPRDPRSVTRVVLVRRRYHLPPPERQPAAPDITAEDLLAFGPDGGPLP